MDKGTRNLLAELWRQNEARLADALDLKAGAESPPEAEARLLREQDEIEADLGTDYRQRRQEELDSTEQDSEG